MHGATWVFLGEWWLDVSGCECVGGFVMLPCIKENKTEAQKFILFNLPEWISKIPNMSGSKNF